MASQDSLNSELESFRQQWLSDLRTKNEVSGRTSDRTAGASSPSFSGPAGPNTTLRASARPSAPPVPSAARRPAAHLDDDSGFLQGRSFDELPAPSGHTLADEGSKTPPKELVSALDHYEEAMEKEASGNMGDSLNLYRKAYRLDHRVDRRYREKHLPAGIPPSQPPAAAAQPATTAPGTTDRPEATTAPSIGELMASFSNLRIPPAEPEMEGMPQPVCPIADLPDEILIHVLEDIAMDDVGDFVRLSRVCKHFAFLVAKEEQIWRRVTLGEEFGFGGMHYHWRSGIGWESLEEEEENIDGTLVSMRELGDRRKGENLLITKSLMPAVYPTWKSMFRSRPRLRFNGCYISTVNYIRTGQASTNQLTWNSPIHIVTYYRYLRFFRDGTAISLLTTSEPGDVVHHLTREALRLHCDNGQSYLPSAVMYKALRGRWRLSSALDHPEAPMGEQEGDLYVETEGVKPVYIYTMDLSLRSAGKGARNNKVVWRGFYSYNKLTDDWAEFALKNDKPFFFSRVKSYGIGE